MHELIQFRFSLAVKGGAFSTSEIGHALVVWGDSNICTTMRMAIK
jgi:hypothetical protein